MRTVLISALCLIAPSNYASAQEVDIKNRCFINGSSFSQGSLVRSGSKMLRCQAEAKVAEWIELEESTGANCLHKNSYYGPGAVLAVTGAKKKLFCQADGTWNFSE